MTVWLQDVVAYSVQSAVLIAAGGLALAAVRLRAPRESLRLWQSLLLAAVTLPVLQGASRAADGLGDATVRAVALHAAPRGGATGMAVATLILWALGAGIVVRWLWLALGASRLAMLRRRSSALICQPACLDALQAQLQTSADVRVSQHIDAPVAVGIRHPLILVPPRFDTLTPDIQTAVLCHELLHVRRRDWLHTVVEELLCSILWFHPVVSFAVSRIRLLREATVDREAIRITGARRAYLQALLVFAVPPPRRVLGAAAFLRARQLARRISFIRQEGAMSRRHFAAAVVVGVFVVSISSTAAAARFPVRGLPSIFDIVTSANETHLGSVPPAALPAGSVAAPIAQSASQPAEAVQAPPPPPPPPPQEKTKPAAKKSTKATKARTIPPPPPPPPPPTAGDIRNPDAPPPPPPPPPRRVGDAAGGIEGGVPGGVPGDVAKRFADAARPGGGVIPPRVLHEVKPNYTGDAMRAKIQGSVWLEAIVLADGTVGDVVVITSLDSVFGLDDAAIIAARQWTFQPGMRDGVAVPVAVTIELTFTLRK